MKVTKCCYFLWNWVIKLSKIEYSLIHRVSTGFGSVNLKIFSNNNWIWPGVKLRPRRMAKFACLEDNTWRHSPASKTFARPEQKGAKMNCYKNINLSTCVCPLELCILISCIHCRLLTREKQDDNKQEVIS